MTITLNGQASHIEPETVLLDLIAGVTGRALTAEGRPADGQRLGVAVAVNAEVVPRGAWASTTLRDGDEVELVTAVQGG